MPKSGVRMLTDRPASRKPKGPIVKLEIGAAYTARKGSNLRYMFGGGWGDGYGDGTGTGNGWGDGTGTGNGWGGTIPDEWRVE